MQHTTRIIKFVALAVLFLAASIPAAFAHGGFEHVMGTVSKISAQSVTVTTAAKKAVEVGINAKTTYTRGDKTVTASDMKVGDRVVIDATEVNEALVAASVKLGAATPTTAQKAAK
jgi:hypothetical protein